MTQAQDTAQDTPSPRMQAFLDWLSAHDAAPDAPYRYPVTDERTDLFLERQDPRKMTAEANEIIKLFDTPWETALDFGCGIGRYFSLFDEDDGAQRLLLGMEPDPERAAMAQAAVERRLARTRGHVVNAGIEALEAAPAELTFDRILCAQVLGHVTEEQGMRIIGAFHDRLSDDGLCALLLPVIGPGFAEHIHHAGTWDAVSDYTHIIDTSYGPHDTDFRRHVPMSEYALHAEQPTPGLLPVRSWLMPDFPDPQLILEPVEVQTIPTALKALTKDRFAVAEAVIYALHRDIEGDNWPIADLFVILKKC